VDGAVHDLHVDGVSLQRLRSEDHLGVARGDVEERESAASIGQEIVFASITRYGPGMAGRGNGAGGGRSCERECKPPIALYIISSHMREVSRPVGKV
jgi:hypothetical protein